MPTRASDSDILMPLEVGGLRFRNQFVVASGPTVKNLEMVRRIEAAGWGAASLKLAIDPTYISIPPRYRWLRKERYHAFTAETRLGFEEGLRLMEAARGSTSELILYANMAYAGEAGEEGWARMARKYEEAGAHVIELNMCCPNMSFNVESSGGECRTISGASVGCRPDLVSQAARAVRAAVDIPVFVKLTPEGGRIAEVAKACFEAGVVSAGTTANRLAVPDFDVYQPEKGIWRLQAEPTLACFSGPWIRPLALRDVYEMRTACDDEDMIMGSGGVETWKDAVRMMMCGADFVQVCTATMLHGFDILGKMMKGLKRFMDQQGYSDYREFRGLVCPHITPAHQLTLYEGVAMIDEDKCTACGLCQRIGHCYAISQEEDEKARVNPADCTGCSTCVDICPAGAASMKVGGKL